MSHTVTATPLDGVLLFETLVHEDQRGFFVETWSATAFAEATGLSPAFVQDNHSRSAQGVLRGLHYQLPRPQEKLVRCARGEIFDVAVDLRESSSTFGKWFGVQLTGTNGRQLWIPAGFAHGFLVLSEEADVTYKVAGEYDPDVSHVLAWDDAALAIEWPEVPAPIVLSARDQAGLSLSETPLFE